MLAFRTHRSRYGNTRNFLFFFFRQKNDGSSDNAQDQHLYSVKTLNKKNPLLQSLKKNLQKMSSVHGLSVLTVMQLYQLQVHEQLCSENSGYTRITSRCYQFFFKERGKCSCSKSCNKQIHVNQLTVVHSQQLLTSQTRWPPMLPKVLCFLAERCCCTSSERKSQLSITNFHTKLYIFPSSKNGGIYVR